MTSPVDIRSDHLRIVQDVLRAHLPGDAKAWVFGSRAAWTTKDSSDLDLAVESEMPFDSRIIGVLQDAFEDSDLPYTVDVVDINRISSSFKQIIEAQKIPLSIPKIFLDTKNRPNRKSEQSAHEQGDAKIGQASDITAEHRKTVLTLLERHLPNTTVWTYRSRAKQDAQLQSDLDLVVFASPKQSDQVSDLREAFKKSDLPYRVELFVWDEMPESFREQIEAEHVMLADNDWVSLRLGEVCIKIGSGATPRGGKDAYLKDGIFSLIRSQNVYNNRFSHDGLAFISEQHATELNNVEVFPDDVLLNITGDSVARVCQVAPDVLPARVNQHVAIIRPDSRKLSARFLRYFLVSPNIQKTLLSWAESGGTRNALTKGMIESFDVQAPADVAEQHAIAHILGTLDDKIELNRRMNETLEAMARALFKSWFIDFDPVRAKMEGRYTGLLGDIAKLFPDRMVDSELGEIPEGWEVYCLGEMVGIVKGRSYRSQELDESDTALVTLKSFARGGGYRPDGLKSFKGNYKPEQAVYPGEIVIACTDVTQAADVIGRPAIVQATAAYSTLVASLDTLIVRPNHIGMTKTFLYFLTYSKRFTTHTYSHTTGTTVLHLAKQAVLSFQFVRPSVRLSDLFDDIARPILECIQVIQQESESLAALRDMLLPKLVSGELRVRDAEAFLERMV